METCLPYAVNAQFKVTIRYEDGRREACDWDRVMKMFAGAGYRGYVSLEYRSRGGPNHRRTAASGKDSGFGQKIFGLRFVRQILAQCGGKFGKQHFSACV